MISIKGRMIKHKTFVDVAFHVHKVGRFSPAYYKVTGWWVCQAMEHSYYLSDNEVTPRIKQTLKIYNEYVKDWFMCNENVYLFEDKERIKQNPCIRHMEWIPLAR